MYIRALDNYLDFYFYDVFLVYNVTEIDLSAACIPAVMFTLFMATK